MTNGKRSEVERICTPVVFCGQCGRYVGAQTDCIFCGWQRPAGAGIPGPGEMLWRYDKAVGWQGRMAYHGGVLFAVDAHGSVHALHAHDGGLLWPQPVALGVRVRSLLADAEHVYIATRTGEVIALARETGQEVRRVSLGASAGGLTLADGRLYVGNSEGRIIALTIPSLEGYCFRDGLGQVITAAPVVVGDLLLAVSRGFDGRLGVFCRRDGTRHQVYELGAPVGLSPVVIDDRAVAVTDEGDVFLFSLRRGQQPHRVQVDDRVACLDADAAGIWLGTWHRGLLRLTWEGRIAGQWFEGHGVVRGMATWAGLIFVADAAGALHRLAGEPPALASGCQLPGDPTLGPTMAEGRVFLGTADGALVALAWHLGDWRWAAEWCTTQNALEAAAAFHALSGEPERAAALWCKAGRPERAARMWESLGEPLRAGEAFLAAAERYAGTAPVRAAGFYNLAANQFRQAHQPERARSSRERAASMGNFPYLTAALHNLGRMEVGEPGSVALRLCNEGTAVAHSIRVHLGGQLARMVLASLQNVRLAPGQELILEVDNLVATVPGASQLVVRLSYCDGYGQEHVSEPAPFDLQAVEPPPGRVTVSGAQVGLVKITLSEGAPAPSVRIAGGSVVGSVRVE